MDFLRGVAIVLVIAWHAPGIPSMLGSPMPDWLRTVNDFLLPYRMPTLMFLSGLLVPRSLEKPLTRYYWGKYQLVLWPYLIWSGIHMVQHIPAGPITNPQNWIATGYLWFLFFIGVYYSIAPFMRYFPAWCPPTFFAIMALALPEGHPERFAYFAIFFFSGALVATHAKLLDAILRGGWVIGGAGLVAVAFGTLATRVDTQYETWGAPFSICGIAVAIYLASRVNGRSWTIPFRFIGRSSLVFYVAHFPIIYGAWTLFTLWSDARPDTISIALFFLALSACTGLAYFQNIPPIKWLFRAPSFPSISTKKWK
ncbi:acyltransferase family protein [Microbacterium amylolyticum]|nr:acyltransferase [Microbacterium amylolyticum]